MRNLYALTLGWITLHHRSMAGAAVGDALANAMTDGAEYRTFTCTTTEFIAVLNVLVCWVADSFYAFRI